MTPALDTAVTRLYAAFADRPRPVTMAYCDHCVSAEEVAALLRVPPRALTADQLRRYATKCVSTWGDVDDLRRLLPRLLELLATGELDDPVLPESLLGTVGPHLAAWPAGQRQAVEAYLRAWWAATLSAYPGRWEATTVLAAVGAAGLDVRPFLVAWAADGGAAAARHLADHLVDPLPRAERPWVAAVRAWRAGPEPARMLEDVLLTTTDPAVAAQVSAAYELLG
ncbi:hypothetical protein [Micromonospora auratinigra]|uniref:HEAT repeat-containing protein n=1 Tax=Micromonospora auratinigra TaxID=261654 RepID=A0A1A8Z0Y3_9ACTN|nr:hypothetical protein [Micromonospora auratinigra]SBT37460.1 hypothetical protein GA0070611_0217 [Micromonospora auratinigra]